MTVAGSGAEPEPGAFSLNVQNDPKEVEMMTNEPRVQELLNDMETAMRKLEGWAMPLELNVSMQPVYSAWKLMHSTCLSAKSVAAQLDADMECVWVPRGTAVEAQKYAKQLKGESA